MKILLLSDLHARTDWYAWAARQSCDALAIAGDLLDGFSGSELLPQMLALAEWCKKLPVPLVISSGNHDYNEAGDGRWLRDSLPEGISSEQAGQIACFLAAERWMDTLERPGLVTDHRSSILETKAGKLVVTTIPFNQTASANGDGLWRKGACLRKKHRSPWIVLHHEPLKNTTVGGRMGDVSVLHHIQEYRPDFALSGHIHDQPYRGGFADRVGSTWCFNPGTPPLIKFHSATQPNSILLDLESRTATWTATHHCHRRPISASLQLVNN